LTSIKEGLPRALMQAMAVGVPVVATNVKGNREVVRHGKTGFLVPLDDADALAHCLARLLESPGLRRDMGAYAAQHARRHFGEDRRGRRPVPPFPPGPTPRRPGAPGDAPALSAPPAARSRT